MTKRSIGSYPGGPRPRRDGDADRPRARLESLEERAARAARERREREASVRRGRVAAVLLGAFLLAGGVGFALGFQADKRSEELTAEREQARNASGIEGVLRGEANRVIQQMWLTEIMDRQPSTPD